MKFGILNVPYGLDYAAGRETVRDVIEWDLQIAKWSDQYGLDELYFAEHYTLGNETCPAPDLMIAAASQVAPRIKLGALGHLLPYHNPVALAHRMMWLDHMTGGRYVAGLAPGAFPSDAQLFGTGKNNPEMLIEAIDIIKSILTKPGPWRIEGKYWTADMPAYADELHGPHLRPLQQPHPEFLMTGMQPESPTLTQAGRNGFSPVSQEVCVEALLKHWETYSAAAETAGHRADRNAWRIVRDYWVADTDEQARAAVLDGPMGQTWREHNLPTFKRLNIARLLGGSEISADDITFEWMVDNFFIVGSPDTVAEKIRRLYEEVGGFGTLLMAAHGRGTNPDAYRRSIELIGTEVAPRVADLQPEPLEALAP
ncbi:LLM class flavin-dependent oxidoreductase [Mycolicibacterium septicum DSM 44393]|uniref:LLM class flavin-dependent oxidoreductase n=1 Tax=Mycolicibacterium septicum DSM 44393 TaxID=1341646 RepID=A0A7X6ML60_9MYCO|nr:LLM class flavin-dependent oxidoreductase [Mycolicibacterium septicum]NKZ10787.1 LLM class flavin-dependent oxidoreductase [Mycolicibacterium septicum DSM 44393]